MQVNKKSILYLSYDGMTDPLGQSQVIPYLHGLAALGYSVHLVSFEKRKRFDTGRDKIQHMLDQSRIIWHPHSYSSRPPIFSTVKDILRMHKSAEKLINQNQINLVHCRSYISALVGLSMKRKLGVKFLFDMRGFWADERVDGRIWNVKNYVYRTIYTYFKQKEIQFLNEADAIVSLTHTAAYEIASWKNFKGVPIDVIPCCADLTLFSAKSIQLEQKQALRSELEINHDAFVLSYLGSLGTWYMLAEMLDFFKVLLEYKPNAVFLFITGDNPDEILRAAAERCIVADRIVIKSSARTDVPLYASLSQISVFFIRPTSSKKASSPTKMGELMAGGIPLIVNAGVGDVEQIMKDGGNGRIIQNFTASEYHNVCRELDMILSENPERTALCAQKWYSLEQGIARYASIYNRILGEVEL